MRGQPGFTKGTGAWRIIPLSKWLITMVSKSPKWGNSPYKWLNWLVNGGYQLLTNWDDGNLRVPPYATFTPQEIRPN